MTALTKQIRERLALLALKWMDRPLGNALHASLTAEEHAAFDRIEQERARLGERSHGSKKPRAAQLLYRIARELRPKTILELGTNVGISSSYLAHALAPGGRVFTLDANPQRLALAREVHERLGLTDRITIIEGRFEHTLQTALQTYGPVDVAFVDGCHQRQPTLDYTTQLAQYASPEAVFIYDDLRWSDGMIEVWDLLRDDPRFRTVVDLKWIGITRLAPVNGRDLAPFWRGRYVTPRLTTVAREAGVRPLRSGLSSSFNFSPSTAGSSTRASAALPVPEAADSIESP